MTYTATIKFSYTTDSQDSPSKYFPESVDRKTITIEAPAEDLNIHQYYELFKSFLAASGFCEYSIMDGACRVAFNDSNSEAQMKQPSSFLTPPIVKIHQASIFLKVWIVKLSRLKHQQKT